MRGEVQPVQYPFHLDGDENNYALHLGSRENQESALHTGSSGLPFSTSDRDNDQRADLNCAQHLSGETIFLSRELAKSSTFVKL